MPIYILDYTYTPLDRTSAIHRDLSIHAQYLYTGFQ
jgi:hypothetical protein